MTINVFLDGLNQIGYSLALALPKDTFELQAFDPDGKFLRKLKREKVIKKPIGQLAQGCKKANIIIINQPVDFLELHYEAIGLNINPGTIVVDTTPVPLYAGNLADKFLPEETAFVSMIPAFNLDTLKEQPFTRESAGANAFTDSTIAISTPPTKLKDAEQVATKLAYAVGASVVYMDPYEAQEAMVKTQMLPKLTAMAIQRAIDSHVSWRDEQRVASTDYFQSTNPLLGIVELEQPELALLENKESLVRILDETLEELQSIRTLIEKADKEALRVVLNETFQSRLKWQEDRQRNSFGAEGPPSDMPENDMFQRMLLGGLGGKKKK
jgi:prephenate dehydrogenase